MRLLYENNIIFSYHENRAGTMESGVESRSDILTINSDHAGCVLTAAISVSRHINELRRIANPTTWIISTDAPVPADGK